jgi:hypothetical protein
MFAAACAIGLCGAARAQGSGEAEPGPATDAPALAAPSATLRSLIPARDLHGAFIPSYALERAVKDPQANRTEVDHSFAPGGLTGALGYLCGVDSFAKGSDTQGGPASSYGHGTTFLGAKLVLPFR